MCALFTDSLCYSVVINIKQSKWFGHRLHQTMQLHACAYSTHLHTVPQKITLAISLAWTETCAWMQVDFCWYSAVGRWTGPETHCNPPSVLSVGQRMIWILTNRWWFTAPGCSVCWPRNKQKKQPKQKNSWYYTLSKLSINWIWIDHISDKGRENRCFLYSWGPFREEKQSV